jgi:hypothetical protein
MAISGIAYIVGTSVASLSIGLYALGFAINMIVASVISKALFNPSQPSFEGAGSSPNLGNRQQVPPATDNKLPVVYGSSYIGGQVTDLSISQNNQELYYVISLCEVTGTESGQTVSTFTFGNIYWGGKLVTFQGNGYTVASLTDESTGVVDTTVNGLLEFYLYSNGSNNPTNSPYTAIEVMSNANLTYIWDETKLMSNCVFAIAHLTYNQPANIVGLQQTKFQVNNSLKTTGNVIYDYLINTRYGGAIPQTQIDTDSLNALTAYSEEVITYIPYSGGSATQKRFQFNGVIETTRSILQNLQDMSSCCDCLIKYSEMYGKWGVIVQSPTYEIALALDDSNIISGITTTPLDIANSFNIAEVKFPDNTAQDAFNTSIYDLAQIDPALLYPNEPVNKQSISLPLTNNSVTAQLLANRFLKSAREDLQVSLSINYIGLQLDAGDIVTVTNVNYGWTNKLFRCQKVTQTFSDSGQITANLSLSEFNPAVYDDVSITQFTPAPNTGIGNPTFFGVPPAPTFSGQQPTATNPSFQVNVTTSPAGITQYAEIWYSAFSNPTADQRIFAGTTEIQSNGNPYSINTAMPPVTVSDIPSGNWYFFSRMVNSLASSIFSPASSLFQWRPSTFQYTNRYLAVAYATSITGTGFSFSPTNKTYYGLANITSTTAPTSASDYTWYPANPNFGTISFLLYTNRTGRKFSFATGQAGYASGSASFVPTQITTYDPSIWLGLPNGTNIIDLDVRTGQVIQTGTTTVGTGQIGITNNPDGTIVAGLQQYLDFGNGITTKTYSSAFITVDIYGRVVGFEAPDSFYYTTEIFTATAGQTVFTVTRGSGYISGQCLVFSNGILFDTSQYTDTSGSTGTVTLSVGATLNDIITIISVKSVSNLSIITTGASGTGSIATLTFTAKTVAPFAIGQSITVTGLVPSGYNGTYTVTACTTSSVSYANTTTGTQTTFGTITLTNPVYTSFTRNTATLTNQSTYTASGFTLNDGHELLFLNGTIVNAQDYNISGQDIIFIGSTTGDLQIVQWENSNLGIPVGNPVNVDTYTIVGQTIYPFSFDPNAFNLYNNGLLFKQGTDYTTSTGSFTLTNTPTSISNILVQQTFTRTGAV